MTQEIKTKFGELWSQEGLTFNNFQIFMQEGRQFIRKVPPEVLSSAGF